MYSGLLSDQDVDDIVSYCRYRNLSMKLGILSGTGGACCGTQLMTFTSHGFAWGLLQKDRVTDFIMMLYSASNHAYTRGFWTAPESTTIDRTQSSIAYCSPSEGIVPLMMKWMFVFEDPTAQTVWIGKAIPRDYLDSGRNVTVLNATVSYGSLTVKYFSTIAENRSISVYVDLQLQIFPLNGIKLRVRSPGKLAIKNISLNGKMFTDFNVTGEYLHVPLTNDEKAFVLYY